MLPTKIYLGMDWFGFVKMKPAVPTPDEFWNSLWAFVSALFLHGFQMQRLKTWPRSRGGRWQEQKLQMRK